MSQTIIIYEAKCKHCIHFGYKRAIKKNGEKGLVSRAFCKNINSENYNNQLTLKTKACNKLEL